MSELLQAKPANRVLDWQEAIVALGLGITGAWVILLVYGLYESHAVRNLRSCAWLARPARRR
jgi:hypothetical protein